MFSQAFSLRNIATRSHNGVQFRGFKPSSRRPFGSTTILASSPDEEMELSGYSRPVVQWYPGHIAKAERMLQETMKAVDVVVEVRDARAAKATSHPMVGSWCAGSPRLVVLTHMDSIPGSSRQAWKLAYDKFGAEHPDQADVIDRQVQNQAQQALRERLKYSSPTPSKKGKKKDSKPAESGEVEDVIFVNAKMGAGIHGLTRSILQAGSHVQERRERRGLKERPLRVGVIGYPNVGKSALINRLLGRRRARTANMPGVTRSLQWIRVRTDKSSKGKEFELLDSPGIIPATLVDQSDATLLAACNCIGQAAYDNQAVAAYLCEWVIALHKLGYGAQAAPEWRAQCKQRYGFDPLVDRADESREMTGEDMLFQVADRTCQGDPEDASRKILQDFRTGRMGLICLQVAPVSEDEKGQRTVLSPNAEAEQRQQAAIAQAAKEQQDRAKIALETAKERGLELPPMVSEKQAGTDNESKTTAATSDVGKGMFEGW